MDSLLEVKNLSFSFDGIKIFENITFSVERGDVLCVLGSNGTGKTTLIKCLNGLYVVDSGQIRLDGKNIKELSFSQISKHIGYIPNLTFHLFHFQFWMLF